MDLYLKWKSVEMESSENGMGKLGVTEEGIAGALPFSKIICYFVYDV